METVGRGILARTLKLPWLWCWHKPCATSCFPLPSLSDSPEHAWASIPPLVPVSSTQVVVGAVLGIGLVKG
jgi:hypothetical protein